MLHWQGEEGDIENAVYLSQRDVRELQFAKASIATGWSLLIEELGIDVSEIQQVLLAGSFGSYLSPASAVRIGLVPKLALPRIVSAGNVAGEGAKMALLSMQERHAATAMFDEVEYVELSDREDFNDRFVGELAFPASPMSATLTVIYWRAIPAQVTAKGTAGSARSAVVRPLPEGDRRRSDEGRPGRDGPVSRGVASGRRVPAATTSKRRWHPRSRDWRPPIRERPCFASPGRAGTTRS